MGNDLGPTGWAVLLVLSSWRGLALAALMMAVGLALTGWASLGPHPPSRGRWARAREDGLAGLGAVLTLAGAMGFMAALFVWGCG
jgi:hypothetical protein